MQLIRDGKFKEDLYYRLCVLEIQLPPLRSRKEDLKELTDTLLTKFNQQNNKYITGFAPEAFRLLESLPLLGNIRELSNIVERLVILCEKDTIDESLFRETVDVSALEANATSSGFPTENLKEIQKETILTTLKKCGGNKAAAARALGIDPSTLWRKLKKYGIT